MNYTINGLKIIIKKDVISDIRTKYNFNTRYETGGIFLGKFSNENKVIEVIESHELKTTFFSQVFYRRNVKKAQKIIDKRWSESGGILNYVGEWHTHPNMQAYPSSTDISSLKKMAEKVENVLPGIILLIAGKDEMVNLIVQREGTIKMQLLSINQEGEV